MPLIIGRIKCWFCKEKAGVIHSVHDYGIYGEVGKRIFYHPECLEMVQIEPERFSHQWADKAIFIGERLEENNGEFNEHIVENYQKKVGTLYRHHFERMMPRKTK